MRDLPATRHELLYGSRIVRCFSDRPATIDSMFRDAVTANSDRVALVEGQRRMTYAALEAEVSLMAATLLRRGFAKGERLALLMGNEIEFVVAFLATARIGMISVPMNTRQKMPEVAFVLNQCAVAAVIVDSEYGANLPPLTEAPSVRAVFALGDLAAVPGVEPCAALLVDGPQPEMPVVGQEDTLCLLYTSGTTGRPKGAMLTHVSTIHSLIHYAWGFDLQRGDVAFLSVPASHVTGIVAILLTTFYIGGTTVIIRTCHIPEGDMAVS